ncbi:MAG: tyrosine-type recombinase/integrase [Candidatus Dormibacteraceae bacterium]
MTTLVESAEQYLGLRRSLGFKLGRPGQLVTQFAAYCHNSGYELITTELALAWARQPAAGQQLWWSYRLNAVRSFARYLHAMDSRHEVPASDLLPAGSHRAEPFIYTDAHIVELMMAARQLPHPLKSRTYETYIGLLAVTGMRAGEAISLDRDDVNWSNGLLTVRGAKFGKSREVVLQPSTMSALHNYDTQRLRLSYRPSTPAFFISTVGTRLNYNHVHHVFHRLTQSIGLTPLSARCRPRIHDLRHSFAVHTLVGWYHDGVDVAERMPSLTTYLGHSQPAHTYWYLSATPELFALVGNRLEKQLGDLP